MIHGIDLDIAHGEFVVFVGPLGITLYQGEFTLPWPIISAALIVAIVPIAAFQERVGGGLTQGGSKG